MSDSVRHHGLGLPGSSVYGILKARMLEWVAIPFSRRSSQLRDRTRVSCIEGRFFTFWATGKIQVKATQSCLTRCNPMDYTDHEILQARTPEWVPFSRGSSQPGDRTQVSCIAGGFFTSWAIREAPKSPYDPAISLLGVYLEKTISWKDTCTPIFIAALFTMPGHGSNLNAHQQRNG